MKRIPTGLYKIAGISLLLVVLWALMAWFTPESFLKPNNIENLMRRTALYGVLGIGVAFVIITAGIDLSIGSVVCFSATLLAILLSVEYQPLSEFPIRQARVSGEVELDAGHSLQAGDAVRFDRGNRASPMIARVVSVSDAGSTSRLVLEPPVSRDDTTGYLVRAHEIRQLGESGQELTVGSPLPVAARDELWLVHPEKGLVKRRIAGAKAGPAGTRIEIDQPANLDTDWLAIGLRRQSPVSVPAAILIVLVAGLGIGLYHGLLITRLNLQPFVVTLCSLLIFRGISRELAEDQMRGFGNDYPVLNDFASGKLTLFSGGDWTFGIPWPFFVLSLVMIAAMIFLNMTVWGRYMQALGSNEEATRYSGVNTRWNKTLAYMICSGLAALGGMMFVLDSNSIAPYSFGNFFELYAIAAAVLGGCSLRGGEGGILGVIVGTALMQTIYNMIVLWKFSARLEMAIVGIVILLGVIADELLKRAARRRG